MGVGKANKVIGQPLSPHLFLRLSKKKENGGKGTLLTTEGSEPMGEEKMGGKAPKRKKRGKQSLVHMLSLQPEIGTKKEERSGMLSKKSFYGGKSLVKRTMERILRNGLKQVLLILFLLIV